MEKKEMEKHRFLVDLDRESVKALKIEAVKKGENFKNHVETILADHVKNSR